MPTLRTVKTNFTAGEVSTRLLGRADLRAYENGAARLRNVFVDPAGGVFRRPGLGYVATARGAGRLVAFEFNTEQVYLLVFTPLHLDIYRDGVWMAHLDTPWDAQHIPQINWTQSADTLLVVHPEMAPRKITRTSHTDWTIASWSFAEVEGRLHQPYFKFADDTVTLTPSATAGAITLTASAPVFVAGHAGQIFRLGRDEARIDTVTSPTQAAATVRQTLAGTDAVRDWGEPAFSAVRGWPVSVCFHQDRMIVGGSRDLPNRLWMSKSGDLFNFDLGEGLDDEAIEFGILSDQVNAIRAVFSGRHLQVFTSGAEWMVTGDPLTPANAQLNRQTRVGSPVDRTVPPRDIDGATLFAGRTGRELREFLFTDIEQAYQSTDLALLARHLFDRPVDQDYDARRRLLHIVMGNGTMATLTVYRAEQITAWTLQETDGRFLSVAVAGEEVYALVERDGPVFLERLDEALTVDSGLTGTAATPEDTWGGLDHLEGRTVRIVADGRVDADRTVTDGRIAVEAPARSVAVGLGFTHVIEPLPPSVQAAGAIGQGSLIRLVTATFRLIDTPIALVDVGGGDTHLILGRFDRDARFDEPPEPFTGDRTIRALGWRRDGIAPLWSIAQDAPFPFTLLSVTTELKVND